MSTWKSPWQDFESNLPFCESSPNSSRRNCIAGSRRVAFSRTTIIWESADAIKHGFCRPGRKLGEACINPSDIMVFFFEGRSREWIIRWRPVRIACCLRVGSRKGRTYYRSEIDLYFLIFSCLIFESSVDRGTPSFAAAPSGPATFPLHSANAVSMISLS
jgi:hypothetical protein